MLCTSLTILINPYLVKHISDVDSYHTPSEDIRLSPVSKYRFSFSFPYKKFSAKRLGVTSDTMNDYYFYHSSTGETIPLYITVPCGRCPCCLERKSREWQFRALCENATSSTIPLFVTLTYNPENLPFDGVNKRDVQLFMKRLRTNLTRAGYSPSESKFRYFACAEYGHNTHRPHYHLIFWNFPDMETLHKKLSFIERAWEMGFCYCVPVKQGAISYVMKYVRKKGDVPSGKNDIFFLSSRRGGGIGYKYLMDKFDFFYNHPTKVDVTVQDPYSGQVMNCIIPKFFRDRLYPSFCRALDKYSRQVVSRLYTYTAQAKHLYDSIKVYVSSFKPFSHLSVDCLRRYIRHGFSLFHLEHSEFSFLDKLPFGSKLSQYEYLCEQIYSLCTYLNHVELDLKKISLDSKRRLQFATACDLYFQNVQEPKLDDYLFRIISRKRLAYSREIL